MYATPDRNNLTSKPAADFSPRRAARVLAAPAPCPRPQRFAVATFLVTALIGLLWQHYLISGPPAAPEASAPKYVTLQDRWIQAEVDTAVALEGLDALARLEKADRLKTFYQSMLRTEQARLTALRARSRRRQVLAALEKTTSGANGTATETKFAAAEADAGGPNAVADARPPRPAQVEVSPYDGPLGTKDPAIVTLIRPEKMELDAGPAEAFTPSPTTLPQRPSTAARRDWFVDSALQRSSSRLTARPASARMPSAPSASSTGEANETPVEGSPNAAAVSSDPNDDQGDQADAAALRSPSDSPVVVAPVPALSADSETVDSVSASSVAVVPNPEPATTDERISLSLEDVDVRTVLEMLAEDSDLNLLIAPGVEGKVSANLKDLSVEQTLRTLTKLCGLSILSDGGVLAVYPNEQLPRDARQLRVFHLDYVRAQTVEETIQGLLSPIGQVETTSIDQSDARRSKESVVVVDVPEVIEAVESYLLQLDQPPRQVVIEARVLEVQLSGSSKHGLDLDWLRGRASSSGAFDCGVRCESDSYYCGGIHEGEINALITVIESSGNARTLAKPKLTVIEGQRARIQIGTNTAGRFSAGGPSSARDGESNALASGVILEVVPTVSRDGQILLEVAPEVSRSQIQRTTGLAEETTRELRTAVLLNPHFGMVVGGLIQENHRNVVRKHPVLGDSRLFGNFFQHRESICIRTELVVTLIPHLLDGSSVAAFGASAHFPELIEGPTSPSEAAAGL
jgi:hypothetical protein